MPMVRRVLDGAGYLLLPVVMVSLVIGAVSWVVAGIALAAGAVMCVRVLRCGVECTPETITVRSYLWSKRIPTGSVLGVRRERPELVWRDATGAHQTTPIAAFKPLLTDLVAKHNRYALDRLDMWLAGQRTA
jgi:hypothetical protein